MTKVRALHAIKLAEEMILREAKPADAAGMAAIYNETIRKGASTDTVEKSADYFRNQLARLKEREIILLLERGPILLGWGIVKGYSDRVGYRVCCETSLYLSQTEVRKGYGSLLKKALISRCREFGYHHLVAKILAVNEASIAYNLRLGYEVVGRQREVSYFGGRWHDVVILQLILDDVPPFRPELGECPS